MNRIWQFHVLMLVLSMLCSSAGTDAVFANEESESPTHLQRLPQPTVTATQVQPTIQRLPKAESFADMKAAVEQTSASRVEPSVSSPSSIETTIPAAMVSEAESASPELHRLLSGEFDFCRSMSYGGEEDQFWQEIDPTQLPRAELPVALALRVAETLRGAKSLAERGASYAAKRELLRALRMTARSLDSSLGLPYHSRALAAGLRALDEAEDFSLTKHDSAESDVRLTSYIQGHRTPVLKNEDPRTLTPVLAMQRYYEYAREQLTIAGGNLPLAAEALCALGRAEMMRVGDEMASSATSPRSLAFFHAAMTIDPNNVLAANELGVILARRGHLQEARAVLENAVQRAPMPVAMANLASIYERLGDPRASALRSQMGGAAPIHSPIGDPQAIVWMTPDAFRELPIEDYGLMNPPLAVPRAAAQMQFDRPPTVAPATAVQHVTAPVPIRMR